MNNLENQNQVLNGTTENKIEVSFLRLKMTKWFIDEEKSIHPFRAILNKEITDHVRSWRFIILIAIMALTCLGSIYTA